MRAGAEPIHVPRRRAAAASSLAFGLIGLMIGCTAELPNEQADGPTSSAPGVVVEVDDSPLSVGVARAVGADTAAGEGEPAVVPTTPPTSPATVAPTPTFESPDEADTSPPTSSRAPRTPQPPSAAPTTLAVSPQTASPTTSAPVAPPPSVGDWESVDCRPLDPGRSTC